MRTFAIIAAATTASALELSVDSLTSTTVSVTEKFSTFKSRFAKVYKDAAEELHALENFIGNEKIIVESNSEGKTYTLGHNQFSDLSWAEFKKLYLSSPMPVREQKNVDTSLLSAPKIDLTADAKDWTTLGAVTPVKNQGQCGSCWAFSTTGSVEGAWQIAGNPLTSLSEQDLVSCATASGNQGCNGGLMDNAFKWIETNGLPTEASYPYTSGSGTTGTCTKGKTSVMKVTGYSDVPQKNEQALLAAITKGMVSAAIEADKSAFQMYKSGVLTSTACGTQLDHGVLAVGYGTDGSTPYYKVKNSWGATWGESGYIRMEQGVNMCGISLSASQPTGATPMGPSTPTPAPAPAAPTPVPAPPAPAGTTHYGDPLSGACMSDEQNITITGVAGSVCSPAATGILKQKCPTDTPAGCTITPAAILQDQSGDKYCALECSPSLPIKDQKLADAICGVTNMSCKPISGVGICTYDA